MRIGVSDREGQQVAAAGATHFQHPGVFQRHGFQPPPQVRGGAQMAGRGKRKGIRGVNLLVVGFGDFAMEQGGSS